MIVTVIRRLGLMGFPDHIPFVHRYLTCSHLLPLARLAMQVPNETGACKVSTWWDIYLRN